MLQTDRLSVGEIRGLIRNRQVSIREVVEACSAKIEEWDAIIHAFVYKDLEAARTRATSLNGMRRHDKSALYGMPVGFKDVIDVAGMPTRGGTRIYGDSAATENAHIVDALLAQDVINMGKLATHELAAGVVTPGCANPFSTDRVPGGSSGGSAAAVATGMVMMSVGSDTGGSGRIPAAYCGVVGFKPTLGLVGRTGVMSRSYTLDTLALIGKTVSDVTDMFSVSQGPDAADSGWTGRPHVAGVGSRVGSKDSASEATRAEGRRTVLGVPENWFEGAETYVIDQFIRVVTQLERTLQWEVRVITGPSLEEAGWIRRNILLPETSHAHRKALSTRAEDFGEDVIGPLKAGLSIPAIDYVEGQRQRRAFASKIGTLFGIVDYLVTPTTLWSAPKVGIHTLETNNGPLAVLDALTRVTSPFNLAATPAISVPCGLDANGVPLGLQIVGPMYSDDTLLQIAAQVERAIMPTRPVPSLPSPH